MRLTHAERKQIIEQLREEVVKDLKAAGCTCEPTMSLTKTLHGPYHLPMWESTHAVGCGLSGDSTDGTGLFFGSSIPRPPR